jgi:small subunit ribosomal protein S3
MVIGRKGAEVEVLKKELQRMTDKEVILNITEVKRPETDALVGGGKYRSSA